MRAERFLPLIPLLAAAFYLYATEQLRETSLGIPISAKAFPRILAGALAVGAVLWFIETLRQGAVRTAESAGDTRRQGHLGIIVGVIVWTVVYYIAFQPVGYLLATTTYLLPLMAYFNRGKRLANALTAVLFSAGSYYAFHHLLSVPLPAGLLDLF